MKTQIVVLILLSFGLTNGQKKHIVEAKETEYGISKKYNISQEALQKANPKLALHGMSIGDIVIIPGVKDDKLEAKPKSIDGFKYITLAPKQTLYSIMKEYNVSESDLNIYNPQLKAGLKIGDVIKIPTSTKTNAIPVVKTPSTPSKVDSQGMYLVKSQETVYSIARDNNVALKDLYNANKGLETDGLKVGSSIKIPNIGNNETNIATIPKETLPIATPVVKKPDYIFHEVKKDDTIYSISEQYKVSMETLLKFNPNLKEGLIEGMTLKIATNNNPIATNKAVNKELNLLLMLPFSIDNATAKNDREISTDFLIGSKLALDSLAHQGRKINLKIIDTGNDPQKIAKAIADSDLMKINAVVGPLNKSGLEQVSQLLAETKIPIISPINNNEALETLPNLIISSPKEEKMADKMIQEVLKTYSNEKIYILSNDINNELALYTKKQLQNERSSATIIITANKEDVKQEIASETNDGGVTIIKFNPIIVIIACNDDAISTDYIEYLLKLDTSSIKAFGIDYVPIYDKKLKDLRDMGFVYSMIRKVNVYGANEINAIKSFKKIYCKNPTKYMLIGFDTMYDLVDRMDSDGLLPIDLSKEVTRLATKFSYEKSDKKAYKNIAVRTVRLQKIEKTAILEPSKTAP